MTVELELTRPLGSLNSEELEHVNLGLIHAFGAQLLPGLILEAESGKRLGLSPSLTLSDLWSTANATA